MKLSTRLTCYFASQPTGKGLELLELAGVQVPLLEQRE